MQPASATSSALPVIPIRNLWYLLLYAWDLARYRDRWSLAAETSPSLLGLLARVLVDTTRDIARRGLVQSYVPESQAVRGIRGRIDFARSLKHLSFPHGVAHCRFEAFGIDTLHNRILYATLRRLARDARVTGGNARAARMLRRELIGLVRRFDGITPVEATTALFNRLPVGRIEDPYPLAMNVCRLVHRLEMPTERQGPMALSALIHDEIARDRLFERFALNFYRLHLGDAFEASSELLSWPDAFECRYAPGMRTDITLQSRRPPRRRIVIDTKFSATTLASPPFGDAAFKSDDLYQIYAYLRSQEEKGGAHRTASGILLYPVVGVHLDEHMLVQGHRIRVATVDLGAPWPDVEKQLLDVVLDWPAHPTTWDRCAGGCAPTSAGKNPNAETSSTAHRKADSRVSSLRRIRT